MKGIARYFNHNGQLYELLIDGQFHVSIVGTRGKFIRHPQLYERLVILARHVKRLNLEVEAQLLDELLR